ncbi:MAG: UDP-N-acetylmuramate dehydrogenase [Treponema sp.]|jgi:UDP-N-acetylmuramate dehydrogenase|nr:UDP-N-acetylmuramate dehydrogenase [Treponema sp.]
MNRLREFLEKINTKVGFSGLVRYDEPMALHTTFRVGGPADVWVQADAAVFPDYAAALLRAAADEAIPVFILGHGANLVVPDTGLRGIVLDTGAWAGVMSGANAVSGTAPALRIRSGTEVDAAVEAAAQEGAGALAFLAGMPASIGGAVYMNARCYGRSVSDTLIEVEILDEAFQRTIVPFRPEDYGYKKSPFQNRAALILSATFRPEPRPLAEIWLEIEAHRQDRERKGHYRFPSAGSVFKNNRAFGKPTGQIIDELGLCGLGFGGAEVAPWHGNIIINTGTATAADIRALVDELISRVHAALGITLEPEILFVPPHSPVIAA